jgi:hypothetical protein
VFQIADRIIDLVVLLFHQSRVKPRRRISRVQLFRPLKFLGRARHIAGVGICLAQVTAQHGAPRFQRRGHEQIFPARINLAAANATQPAAEPRVAQSGVCFQGTIEPPNRVARLVPRGEYETFQRQRLSITRRECEAFVERFERAAVVPETEFQLRDASPRKTKLRLAIDRLARQT